MNGTRIEPAMLRLFVTFAVVCTWLPAAAQQAAKPANRLAGSASPYLLQHAHNPVDWYPWGKEAFDRAKKENKPIFLSVGYSACHWCHVMEKESFSDPEIARLMNESFVCVKVDREERPDVDAVYMAALQAFSGGGGWPMNMILTPDGRPFFGMTYTPPRDRDGDEGFATLIGRVRAAWRDNRKELEHDAENLAAATRRLAAAEGGLFRRGPVRKDLAAHTLQELSDSFDPNYGGFGSSSRQPKAPKFPEPSILMFLWDLDANPAVLGDAAKAARAREMALTTMDNIARGGVRDHLGGGIHRYSTDRYWTVPHFEKMLYDNALWLSVTATAFARTGDARWQAEVDETVTFLKTVMLRKEGGFASSLDADTDGVEGLTYLWTLAEVEKAIAGQPDADLFLWVYGLKLPPNFENRDHILAIAERWPSLTAENKLSEPEIRVRLAPLRKKLLEIRERRNQPFKDDKCLTSWNGLAIGGLADAARLAKHPEALGLAEQAARFLLDKHLQCNTLRHVSRGEAVSGDGPFLEDYAYLLFGLLKLHEATAQAAWLDEARKLASAMIDQFEDERHGGFFETVEGSTDLFVRPRNWFDSALPSPAGIATLALAELARKTGEKRFADSANRSVQAASGYFTTAPDAVLSFVRAASKIQAEMPELAAAQPKPADDEPKPEKPAARKKPMPVKAAIEGAMPVEVMAGKPAKVVVKVSIDKGYHIYANPPTNDTAQPTELRLDEAASGKVRLAGVDYPEGNLKSLSSTGLEPVAIYEDDAKLGVQLDIPAETPAGPQTVYLVLEYQVCTDQFCLPPAKERIPVELKVVRP